MLSSVMVIFKDHLQHVTCQKYFVSRRDPGEDFRCHSKLPFVVQRSRFLAAMGNIKWRCKQRIARLEIPERRRGIYPNRNAK